MNIWESLNGAPPPFGTTGLYHFAILYPNRKELARALKRLIDHGVEIDGAGDHGVSESLYLHDPDGNGIELYADRDRGQWQHHDGFIKMVTRPMDLEALLRELE
ncbi:MAG: VOC family protein [Chloroflexota bacterium]